jgi:hypothetical protein
VQFQNLNNQEAKSIIVDLDEIKELSGPLAVMVPNSKAILARLWYFKILDFIDFFLPICLLNRSEVVKPSQNIGQRDFQGQTENQMRPMVIELRDDPPSRFENR